MLRAHILRCLFVPRRCCAHSARSSRIPYIYTLYAYVRARARWFIRACTHCRARTRCLTLAAFACVTLPWRGVWRVVLRALRTWDGSRTTPPFARAPPRLLYRAARFLPHNRPAACLPYYTRAMTHTRGLLPPRLFACAAQPRFTRRAPAFLLRAAPRLLYSRRAPRLCA